VLTNPYAALPPCLLGLPMLIANFANRIERCEEYVRAPLNEVTAWGRDQRCRIWVANAPAIKVDCSDLIEEEEIPGRGWFPLELPLRLLRAYAPAASIVIDPFMGRGTVGKACKMLGHRFIGIDLDPARVAKAKDYIGA
jgi:hypothetical protein